MKKIYQKFIEIPGKTVDNLNDSLQLLCDGIGITNTNLSTIYKMLNDLLKEVEELDEVQKP